MVLLHVHPSEHSTLVAFAWAACAVVTYGVTQFFGKPAFTEAFYSVLRGQSLDGWLAEDEAAQLGNIAILVLLFYCCTVLTSVGLISFWTSMRVFLSVAVCAQTSNHSALPAWLTWNR